MTDRLTGRQRLRVQARLCGRPLLVLQVEVERIGAPRYPKAPVGTYTHLVWRDAAVEDLPVDACWIVAQSGEAP